MDELYSNIEHTLIELSKKDNLKNLRGIDLGTVFDYGLKVEKIGKIWKLSPVKYNKREEFAKFLQENSIKN